MGGAAAGAGAATMFTGGAGSGAAMATSATTALSAPAATSSIWSNPMLFMGLQGLGTMATSYSQSKSQEAVGEFQAQINASNARIQALFAEDAIKRGDVQAKKALQAKNRLIGSQRAAMGAQGIDVESGSALDIQEETAALGAEDALNIRNNAWREAWGFRANEAEYDARAEFAKITARNKARNTLLTGGMNAVNSFGQSYYRSQVGYGSLESLLGGY